MPRRPRYSLELRKRIPELQTALSTAVDARAYQRRLAESIRTHDACLPDCMMCSGECCNLCGAGCWSNVGDCEHDVIDRHLEPIVPRVQPEDVDSCEVLTAVAEVTGGYV